MKKEDINIDMNGTPHRGDKKLSSGQKWLAQTIGNSYWVMISSDGLLFNPLDSSESLSKKDKERGKLFYTLERCGVICYNYYVNFLRTKHKTHLILAQRNFDTER